MLFPRSFARLASTSLPLAFVALLIGGPGLARSGLHVGLGLGAGRLDLSPRLESAIAQGGARIDEHASGGHLRLGYTFRNQVALDLVFAGLDIETGARDLEADYGEARLELLAPLTSRGDVRPYVAGALGGAVLGFGPDEDELEEVEGSLASFGGGVDVLLGRRTRLGFDYRYGVLDFDREAVELPQGPTVLDGTGTAHTWGFRFQFGF